MKSTNFHRDPILQDSSDSREKPPRNNLALLALVLLATVVVCAIFTGSTFNADITLDRVRVEVIGKQQK